MAGMYPSKQQCSAPFNPCAESNAILACSFAIAPEFTSFAIAKKSAPKAPAKSALASKLASSAASAPKPTDDKHEILRRTTEAAQMSLQKEEIQAMNKALEEDPTLFDYDEFHEELQPQLQTKRKPLTGNARYGYGITVSETRTSKGANEPAPQHQYIESLLAKARDRETERELVLERQRHRENLKYEEVHGKMESFVTPEYQAKLAEDQQKRDELDRKEAKEQSGASMSNFYANMSRQTFGDSDERPDRQSDSHESKQPSGDSSHRDSDFNQHRRDQDSPTHDKQANGDSERKDLGDLPSSAGPTSATGLRQRPTLTGSTVRKPRRHTDEMVEEAKSRYQQRQALRALTQAQATN